MPKECGLDVLSIRLSPSIEVTPLEESSISELQKASEILSEELNEEIFPGDIKEKGKEMADAYVIYTALKMLLDCFWKKSLRKTTGIIFFPV
jgi:hypothetical protein